MSEQIRCKLLTRIPALAAAALAIAWAGQGTGQDTPGGTTTVQVSAEGRQVYEEICQACHMADARGGGGAGAAIPALAGNPRLADKDYPIAILLKGRGGMPWFTDILTPEQMAAVITYVRGHFNQYPDAVTPADIERVATDPAPRLAHCDCDIK
jgi:mono/diheme cytochrome c family protein